MIWTFLSSPHSALDLLPFYFLQYHLVTFSFLTSFLLNFCLFYRLFSLARIPSLLYSAMPFSYSGFSFAPSKYSLTNHQYDIYASPKYIIPSQRNPHTSTIMLVPLHWNHLLFSPTLNSWALLESFRIFKCQVITIFLDSVFCFKNLYLALKLKYSITVSSISIKGIYKLL